MTQSERNLLIKLRVGQSKEYLADASSLLKTGSLKSANNRSYYAMEKAINALLLLSNTAPKTHKGIIQQFNKCFIFEGDGYFTIHDYRKLIKAEQIRNASDYDDFFQPSEQDSLQIYKDAEALIEKICRYIEEITQ